jgi:hypothetical protein
VADPSDYRFEVSARKMAAVPVVFYAAVAGLLAGLTAVVPFLREAGWWVTGLAVGAPVVTLGYAAWYGRALVRGGAYRAEVGGGRVRVESPSRWAFGPSFDVELGAIESLVVRHDPDGPGDYAVRTAAGTYRVDSVCGDDLFAAIRRARPDVPSGRE